MLGAALQRAGHRVVAVSGVSEASRTRAATLLPGVPSPVPEVVAEAHLVVLAVPDDALAALVAGLSRDGHFTPGQLVVAHLRATASRLRATRGRSTSCPSRCTRR